MEVAVYARVSTEDQELQQQITSCRRFCEYKGYEVARVFSEKVSGAKAKRPQYLELVKELRQMQYGGVVVFRLDRLGRNSRELALLIDELENKGIKVLSVNESFDTSTAMGRAMRELIYVFAQLEREQISEATTQRLAAVKLAGKRLGQKPLSEFQVNKDSTAGESSATHGVITGKCLYPQRLGNCQNGYEYRRRLPRILCYTIITLY
jgi:DNA invertase Pin-like site-specific DNA recombinase